MAGAALPLTVIGGFLGAGKTTLINHWLRHAGGQRLAVLVNDFGALNIDAGLIEASAADTIALTNGCVCCQIGDDLTAALIRVLDSAPRFDAVVVEASGVSDPWRIAQMGRADPGLRLDGVIVLVDAGAALVQMDDPLLADTVERQLKAADLVVLNKCDQISGAALATLRRRVEAVAGGVAQFETTQSALPLVLLRGLAMPPARRRDGACDDHAAHDHRHADPDHGAQFDTWSCQPAQAFDAGALRRWLLDVPAGVLRLKGVLRTGSADADWSELQFAGRHGSLRVAQAHRAGGAIVAIGLRGQLPVEALNNRFAVDPRPVPGSRLNRKA